MMSSYRCTARALKSALRNVFHPSILAVLLVPAIGAILIWMGLSWWFWDDWAGAIESTLRSATSDGWVARLDLARMYGQMGMDALADAERAQAEQLEKKDSP